MIKMLFILFLVIPTAVLTCVLCIALLGSSTLFESAAETAVSHSRPIQQGLSRKEADRIVRNVFKNDKKRRSSHRRWAYV